MRKTRNRRPSALLKGLAATLPVLAAIKGHCADATAAPSDPLLDLFVKKGFVTQQEADQVKAEAEAMRTNGMAGEMPPVSKWKMSDAVKDMGLFGDVRMRYEDRAAEDPNGDQIDLQRLRYAVRVGLRGDLFDQFYYGIRLETGSNGRSPFVTLGSATTSASSGFQGPFGKSNAGINVGQAYLGWHPWDWLNVMVGKMPNPLYTTPMVWSANLSPEGFAEQLNYNVGPAQFFANFGQFYYADLNPNFSSPGFFGLGISPGQTTPGAGQSTDNIFMFAWQGGVKYDFTTNITAKVGATVYNYIGLQPDNGTTAQSPYFGGPFIGEGAYYWEQVQRVAAAPGSSGYVAGNNFNTGLPGYQSVGYPLNQVGLNHLLVLEIPFEFNVKFKKLEARLFGDFAYNLEGSQRAQDAANAYNYVLSTTAHNAAGGGTPLTFPPLKAQTSDVKAYQIGVSLGSKDIDYGPSQGLVYGTSSPRHSWEVRAYWQHIEQYSLDPNLLDLDFFNGLENMQGFYVAASYAFTANMIGTFRYGHASRINDLLGTGGTSGDIPQINPVNDFDIYQVDLTLRF